MSLLDDVRIVVTPNGYKAGTLFGAIPVPTFGSDEITNGGFATDSDWNKGGGWSIGGGVATANGNANSNISQNIPLTVGNAYSVTYTVVNASVGSRIGISTNATSIQIERTTDGTYTEIFTASLTSFYIRSLWNNGSPVSVDNVSVKEWVGADMDVTRATAATRVDENGLVNYAEIIGGEEVTGFTNGTTYPFTTFTTSGNNITSAIVSSAFAGTASNAISVTSGEIYKVTFDYTKNSGDDLRVLFAVSANGAASAISNKVIISASGTYTEYFTITSTTTGYLQMGTGNSGHSLNVSIRNISVKEVTRDNVPRIDYTGGGCPHILAEPQRTNLVTYSSDFTDSSWLKTSGGAGSTPIVTSSYATSPEGLVNASRIQFECGGVTSGDYSRLYSSFSLNGSSQYGQSFYIKSNTGSSQNLLFFTQNNDGDSITATTEWVRVDAQFTSSTTNFRNFGLIAKGNIQQTVDVLIYGAQLEQGSYPTSLIPTSGSTVTRNQDIFTRDGIGSLINSQEGVLFLEIAALSNDGTNRAISISDGTLNNRIFVFYSTSSNQVRVQGKVGNVVQFSFTESILNATNFIKLAIKYKENDFALWLDGVEVDTDSSGVTFPADTLNELQFAVGGTSSRFFGKVKQLQVYESALTDDQLSSLTK